MAIVQGDILGWWDCQEGTGTTIADNATVPHVANMGSNTSWTTGGPTNLPNGVNFAAANANSKVVVSNDFDISTGSIGVWYSATANPGSGALNLIVGNGDFGGEFDLWIENVAGTVTNRSRTRYTSDRTIVGTGTPTTTTNYFLFYNFASGAMELFRNGVSIGTNTNTGTIVDSGNNLVWGQRSSEDGGMLLNGKIHQVVFFNRTLTGTEINSLYNAGAGVTYSQMFPQIIASYEGSNDDYENAGVGTASARWRAQGFQVSASAQITSVSIYGSSGGGASGSFDIEIRSGAANGTLLYTETFTTATTLSAFGSPAWNNIPLATPVAISSGVQYFLVLYMRSGSTTDEVRWSRDNTSPTYPDGAASYKLGAGATGDPFTNYSPNSDENFRIIGDYVIAITTLPDLRLAFI